MSTAKRVGIGLGKTLKFVLTKPAALAVCTVKTSQAGTLNFWDGLKHGWNPPQTLRIVSPSESIPLEATQMIAFEDDQNG